MIKVHFLPKSTLYRPSKWKEEKLDFTSIFSAFVLILFIILFLLVFVKILNKQPQNIKKKIERKNTKIFQPLHGKRGVR